MGIFEERSNPAGNRIPQGDLDQIYTNVRNVLGQTANTMPSHIEYIERMKRANTRTISDQNIQAAPKAGPGNLTS